MADKPILVQTPFDFTEEQLKEAAVNYEPTKIDADIERLKKLHPNELFKYGEE